ncbi:S-layer homology domain-containing protein [Cytobacillus firmus]|uniref:S-layer homology domain-containing protein n=1 Tax=Cytobacillus firmus TaxID=1399 RepID=UPI00384BFAAA
MAYQPKSYRKFVATAATATLVASAVAPAAAAGFSDVSDRYADAVNYLVENDITNGLTETTFGVSKEVKRGDAAVMIAKALGLDGANAPDAGFGDVPTRAKEAVNALKEAGIFNGKSATNFGFTDTMTRGEMALVIAKAYELEGDVTLTFTDVSDRYEQAVQALVENKITSGKSETSFGTGDEITRGEFAIFLHKAETLEEAPGVVEVAGVSAINAKSLKVTFNGPVDTTKAVFEVKKGTVKVNTSNTAWNADKTEATIELAGKLTKGDYTVNVTGLTEEALSKTISVEDEKVAKIEILSTEAPLVDAAAGIDADTNVDDLQVGYRVLNQYGEDVTKTTSLTTSATNVHVDPANGTVTIVGNYDTNINKLATFTLIHASSATTATATVTAVSEAKISEVSVKGIYNKDGKTLTETTNTTSDLFYVELEAKDQYGNVINDSTKVNQELLVTESNPLVIDAAANASVITVDGKKKVVVALSGTPTVGKSIVTVISKASGKSASATVEVAESKRAYNVDIQAPELAVAGETVNFPVVVTDKDGAVITDLSVLKNGTRGIKVTQGGVDKTNALIVKDGAVVLPTTLTQGYESFVVISNATQKVDTLTVEAKAAAKPTTVTGLKSSFSTTLKGSSSSTITTANLQVEDQYGRVMTQAQLEAWLDAAATNEIVVSSDAGNNVIASAAGSVKANAGAYTSVTVTAGSTNGTENVTIVLKDANGPIVSSTKDVALRVTDGSEYVSYEVADIAKVYDEEEAGKNNAAAYDVDLEVKGVLADGSKVLLAPGEYNVTSSNSDLQTDAQDGTLNVNTSSTYTYEDASGNAVNEIKLPLSVTINATGEKFNKEVTISKVAPKVTDVTVVADGKGADVVAGKTVTELTSGNHDATGAFNFASTYGAFADVVVTDQYGAQVLIDGTDAFADGTSIAAPTLTYSKVSGNVAFSNNGLAGASVTELPLNSAFKFVLDFAGAKSDAVEVKVTQAYSGANVADVAAAKTTISGLVSWNTDVATTVSNANTAIDGATLPSGVTAVAAAGTGANAGKAVITITKGSASDVIVIAAP